MTDLLHVTEKEKNKEETKNKNLFAQRKQYDRCSPESERECMVGKFVKHVSFKPVVKD